jgi:hypothetical protein
MLCNRCKEDRPLGRYMLSGLSFRLCEVCARDYGFPVQSPESLAPVAVKMDEILEEEILDAPVKDFIPNAGNCEQGMPVGSCFGVCPKCAVKHTDAGCPRSSNKKVSAADKEVSNG